MPSRVCAYCDRYAEMRIVAEPQPTKQQRRAAAYHCAYCNEINVAIYSGAAVGSTWGATFDARDSELQWYPERVSGKAYDAVPSHIAQAADEAHRCLSIGATRGALILGRAVIEATAKDKGIVKGTLYDKIDSLQTAGHVRTHTKDAAHEVRAFGNDMAHGDFDVVVEPDDAAEVIAIMDEVLDEIYEGPARVARLQAVRKARSAT